MTADTLVRCGSAFLNAPAVSASVDQVAITGMVAELTQGQCVDIELAPYFYSSLVASVTQSTFGGSIDQALRIHQKTPGGDGFALVSGNTFTGCGGAVDVSTLGLDVHHNVLFNNFGSMVFTPTGAAGYGSIRDNTVVEGWTDGISVQPGPAGIPAWLAVRRNLCVQNANAGIVFGAAFAGTLENNDSWHNPVADYSGVTPGPTNLSVDPRFCDMPDGVLTLAADSPCAPAAITGPIGALGVGCTVPVAGVTPTAGVTAFSVRPNPARGSVEFALPPGTRDGRIEVLDVQGRRVWGRSIAPGATSVRWSGEVDRGGAADPGLYWVRCSSSAGVVTRNLVWLR